MPPGWVLRNIEELTRRCNAGYWGRAEPSEATTRCRVVRNGDVKKATRISTELPMRHFTAKEISRAQVEAGDVILVTSGAYTGTVARIRPDDVGSTTLASNFVRLLKPARDVDGDFLGHLLSFGASQRLLRSYIGGSAIPNLGAAAYRGVALPTPPLPEQHRIAAVLSSVDTAIERAQAVIDQVQVVKRGLMRELLTQGLPGQRKRFKQTDFGEVPETWVETVLGNVLELKRGYDLPRQDRAAGAVPVISSSGVTGTHAEARVEGPGVVTGRYGNIGQVFFVNGDFWPLNTTLYVRDFKGNDPRFISHFLRGLDFSAHSGKTAVPGVNRNHLHRITVVFPPDIAVQRAIAAILSSVDDAINRSRSVIDSIQVVKIALLSALLTGELRVTPDPEPE